MSDKFSVKQQEAINYFLLLSLIIYCESQILPQFVFYSEATRYIIGNGFIIISFALSLFTLLFLNEENVRLQKKINYNFLAIHALVCVAIVFFLHYVMSIDYKVSADKESIFYKIASIFKDVQDLSVFYRIEFLVLIAISHFFLIAAFFRVKLMFLSYLIAFPLGVAVNEILGAIICPVLFYIIWTSKNLYLRRVCSLSFGLALSTVFNKPLWMLLGYSIAKMNSFILGLFFSSITTKFDDIYNPIIGTEKFSVFIADKCSGIEGLTTFGIVFLVIYIPKWRELSTLNFLLVGTVGLILMYFVNVLRIFVLILIGHHFDSQYAVDLWHFYGSIILCTTVIYGYIRTTHKWCFLSEVELAKMREREESMRAPETFQDHLQLFSTKFSQSLPLVMRFPIDLLVLFVHSIGINFAKTKIYKKILKRNCQCYFSHYQENENAYCRFSRWYGTPKVITAICPLLNMQKREYHGYIGCKAPKKNLKIYWFRSLITFCFFLIIFTGLGYNIWKYVENHFRAIKNEEQIKYYVSQEILEEGKQLFAKKKYVEAQKKFLESIQLKFRTGEAYTWLGKTYEVLGKQDKNEIIKAYTHAVNLEPAETFAQLRIAFYTMWDKKYVVEAEQRIRIAQENGANPGETVALLAICEITKENIKEAYSYAQKAYKLSPDLPVTMYLNAFFANNDNNYEEAKKYLQKIQNHRDLGIQSKLLLAQVYTKNSEFEAAQQILQKLIENNNSLDAELALIKVFFLFGMEEKAMNQCLRFIEKISENLTYLEQIAQILTNYNQLDLAHSLTIRNLPKYPNSIPLHLVAAQIFYRHRFFYEMEQHCRFIIANADDLKYTQIAYNLLGDMFLLKRAQGETIEQYQNLLELLPGSIELYCLLGDAFQHKNLFDKAINIYNKAIKINKKNSLPYIGKARTYAAEKKWSEAIKSLNIALRNEPNSHVAQTVLASVYEQKGEISRAKKMYQNIIKKYPKNASVAANNLANLLMKEESNYEEASRLAYRSAQSAKNPLESLDTLAFAFYKMGKYQESHKIQEQLIKISPDEAKFLYHCALTLIELKEQQKAILLLEKALQNDHKQSFTLDIREILKKLKDK